MNILADYSVRADKKVYSALRQVAQDFLLLGRRHEAREHFNSDGERLHTALCRLKMLHCENSRRNENRALLTVADTLERGAQRNLGLTEANVAAEKSVHRRRAFHIALNLLGAANLVLGFLVVETKLKIALQIRILRELIALRAYALRVKRDKLLCHILNARLDLAFRSRPVARAETVDFYSRVLLVGADIFRHQIELRYGDVKRVALRVADFDIVLFNVADFKRLYSLEYSYTVSRVYNIVTDGKLVERAKRVL